MVRVPCKLGGEKLLSSQYRGNTDRLLRYSNGLLLGNISNNENMFMVGEQINSM
jgi:hypothetical protein